MRTAFGLALVTRWRLRGCPRCSGDLYCEPWAGLGWRCLQCGYCGPTRRGRLPDPPSEGRRFLHPVGEIDLLLAEGDGLSATV
jgi:hypothetical protein